jgi:hypothetical protein
MGCPSSNLESSLLVFDGAARAPEARAKLNARLFSFMMASMATGSQLELILPMRGRENEDEDKTEVASHIRK